MPKAKYDFSGWATKNNLKCTDGRTILKDAFRDNDGTKVPLVWQHMHNEPGNILGHAVLENRDEGVYAYCKFNDTAAGKNAKLLVQHGDISALSIYANGLVEKTKNVIHGVIREVSLVLAGANPGAIIDNLSISHADGSISELEDEVIISFNVGDPLEKPELEKVVETVKAQQTEPVVEHTAVPEKPEPIVSEKPVEPVVEHADSEETIGDVFNSLSEKQKTAVYAMIAEVVAGDGEDEGDTVAQSQIEHADAASDDEETVGEIFETLSEKQKTVVYAIIAEIVNDTSDEEEITDTTQHSIDGEEVTMKKNVFEGETEVEQKATLTHDQFAEIVADAYKCGSFRESFLEHVVTYGIDHIDYLFPDARTLTGQPSFLKRDTEWVANVMSNTSHTPFSRIKTVHGDITAAEARAKGYVKSGLKTDEIITLLRRITTPVTIYKKQKLDRDDIVDITDLDVVAWLKAEMRLMLDEEIARAVLVSDGRTAEDADKISETNLRSIWKDEDMYAHHVLVTPPAPPDGDLTNDIMDAIVRGRKDYKGSGNPTFYTTPSFLSDMLVKRDTLGRRMYSSMADLQAALRVSNIVEVPVMDGLTRDVTQPAPATYELVGIVVNLRDYSLGSDKGGAIGMFDDFDIDYNQYKYLIESRCSGALTLPKSALVIEKVATPAG